MKISKKPKRIATKAMASFLSVSLLCLGNINSIQNLSTTAYAAENTPSFKVVKAEKKKNYGVMELLIEVSGASPSAIKDKALKFKINGKEVAKEKITATDWKKSLVAVEEDVLELWQDGGKNKFTVVFADKEVTYDEEKPNELEEKATGENTNPEKSEPKENDNGNQEKSGLDFEIEEATIDISYSGEEFRIKLKGVAFSKLKEVYDQIESYEINGEKKDKQDLTTYYDGVKTTKREIINLWKDAGKEVSLVLKNGKKITWKKDAEAEEKQDKGFVNPRENLEKLDANLADNLAAGEYTIGFEALYADGRQGNSMLQGFFDENVKLVVKEDGTKEITMLNTLFADGLYDFRIQTKEGWPASTKENYGKKDINGEYKQATFTMPIDALDETHLGAVLVGYMGGKMADKGNTDVYTKVKINFKAPIYKGWDNFTEEAKQKYLKEKSKEVLNRRLKSNNTGMDKDLDGTVTAEELQTYKGDINLRWNPADEKDHHGDSIYDIEFLKNMGAGVTGLDLGTNAVAELPETIFDKAVNLKRLDLSGNKLSALPKDIFKNNTELESVIISGNKLGKLPEGIFKNNSKITELDLSKSWIPELSSDVFSSLKDLKNLYLYENSMIKMPADIFENNSKLEILNVNDNSLSELPQSLGKAQNLKELSANNNKLTRVPNELSDLKDLTNLSLKANKITDLPTDLWTSLASKESTINLENNNFKVLPIDILKNGKITTLKVAYNMLPVDMPFSAEDAKKMGIRSNLEGAYFPQKTAAPMAVEAQEKTIKVNNNDLTLLDLLYWYVGDSEYFGGKGILQDKASYEEYKQSKNKDISKILIDDKSWSWYINTSLERNRDGKKVLIDEKSINNIDDSNIVFEDPGMQNGDTYTVRKVLNVQTGGGNQYKAVLMSEVTSAPAIVTQNEELKKAKTYSVPVSLINASTGGPSMGAKALFDYAEVTETEDGGVDIKLTFRPLYLEKFKATGHLTKLGIYPTEADMRSNSGMTFAKVIDNYDDNGKVYPKVVEFHRAVKGEERIAARVWVDMMDEIAKMAGQEDGSQPVIIALDWSNIRNNSEINKAGFLSSRGVDGGSADDFAGVDSQVQTGKFGGILPKTGLEINSQATGFIVLFVATIFSLILLRREIKNK